MAFLIKYTEAQPRGATYVIRCVAWVACACEIETYKIMNGIEVIHGFSKEIGDCNFKTNKKKYFFMGHIKVKTTEVSPHKTECLNSLKKEVENRFSGAY